MPRMPCFALPPRRAAAFAAAWVGLVLMGCASLPDALTSSARPGQPPIAQHSALPPSVQRALAAAGVAAETLAAVALPLGHAGTPWGHRAEAVMQPGSTMKLVTSVVALDRLGPNHRGHTTLRSAAVLDGGVLRGDLWLEGGADPDLGIAQFWTLLMELRALGVKEIAGDVVVDRRLFNPARADLDVLPFDDAPEFGYNAVPDALGLAGGLLPIDLSATPDGSVLARIVPPLQGVEVASRMAGIEAPCADWSEVWQAPYVREAAGGALTVELRGNFPRGCTRRLALNVIDRQRLTEALFRTLWAGLGGQLGGRVREAGSADTSGEAAGMRELARRLSRPWGEVLRSMNKASDNPHTRLLYLSIGAAEAARLPAPGPPAAHAAAPTTSTTTAALAERAVRRWFAEQRIATPGLVLDNGSGLSRSERVTPLTLAQMLQVAWAGRYASDLIASLPLAGEDGTMRLRLRQSPAAGWARLKTGTLRNVAALAGYVRDAEGRPWAVAMMINHERASTARPALDALVDAMVRSARPGAWAVAEGHP